MTRASEEEGLLRVVQPENPGPPIVPWRCCRWRLVRVRIVRHVGRRHAKHERRDESASREGHSEARRDADGDEQHRFAHHQPQHVPRWAPSAMRIPISFVRRATL